MQLSIYFLDAWAKLLDGSGKEGLLLLVNVSNRQDLLDTGFLNVSLASKGSTQAHSELNVDGEVVEVGADLLLDSLTTGLGAEVDVSLDSRRLAVEGSLEDELGKLGTGWSSALHNRGFLSADLEPWRE
jgi:hypothetical protein